MNRGQPLLSARALGKSYGAVPVVRMVDFDVWPGEALGILGPNGAGKTTLFNLISGETPADDGEVFFAGQALGRQAAFRRCRLGIGRTYQIPQPYGGMTTFENLLVAAMFGGSCATRVAYERCKAILDDCELGSKANRLAATLTLLDRKRLELARALACGPRLLLLDEIAGGLTDAESRILVALIRRLRARGVAVLWIEHVLHALMAVADRLLVLNFGEKIAEGRPQDVIENPEVQRVYVGIEA